MLFIFLVRPLEVGPRLQEEGNVGAYFVGQLLLQYQDDCISEKKPPQHFYFSDRSLPPVSITQFVLGHVGLELAPLALDEPVREDHQELAAPVDAVHDVLRHRHPDFEVSLVDANLEFWIFLLEFRNEVLGDPVMLLLAVGDEHVVEVSHVFLAKVLVFPSLFH